MRNNPLAIICIFFSLGIWTAKLIHIPLFFVYISCVLFLLTALVGLKKQFLFSLSLSLVIFLAGFLHLTNAQTYPANHISNFVSDNPQKLYVIGKVVSNPEASQTIYHSKKTTFTFKVWDLKTTPVIASPPKAGVAISKEGIVLRQAQDGSKDGERSRTTSSLAPRNDKEKWHAVQGLIRVTLYGERRVVNGKIGVGHGDELLLQGSLVRPPGLRNPGGFNYREYLANHNIFGLLKVKEKDAFKVMSPDQSLRAPKGRSNLNPEIASSPAAKQGTPRNDEEKKFARNDGLLKGIFKFKQKLHNIIYQHLEAEQAALLSAILLGERANLSQDIKDLFIHTGTVHILAISGLHVGLVAFIFISLLRMLRLPRRLTFIFTILFLICYALLSGARPSVVRATIMAVIVLLGLLIDREIKIYNSLGLAALIILIYNPRYLFDSGFQLSFSSVFSIVYFAPKVTRLLSATGNRYLLYLIRSFSVSLAAWIGVAPLTAFYFNIVSPVAILANLIVIPLLFLVVSVGICFLIFTYLWVPLGSILSQTCWFTLLSLTKSTALISKIPLGFFHCPKPGVLFLCTYYGLALSIFSVLALRTDSRKSQVKA